jgi:hypothetical protein
MINFVLGNFVTGRNMLHQSLREAQTAARQDRSAAVPSDRMKVLTGLIQIGIRYCVDSLHISRAQMTAGRIENLIDNHEFQSARWGELHELLRRLWDEIHDEIEGQCFFHYKVEDAKRIVSIDDDWKEAIGAFPSVKPEISAGIDCYATGNYVGCIFHMSRIAEIGLRSIGRERGISALKRKKKKPVLIEFATWKEVFDAIEPTLDNIRSTWPKGVIKDSALAFYGSVLSDLRHIQGFRDQTMHFRTSYDFGEAESVMFRVHSLMTTLAAKIDENTRRAIPRSAWR